MPDEIERRRTRLRAPEILAAIAGLAVFAYAGWDGALWDARWQLLLHLLAIGAVGGLIAYGRSGSMVPRTPIDLPILALVAAEALATVFAINVGMSLRALAAITATALMLPVALIVLRLRPNLTALVVCVPATVLAIGSLIMMLNRRLAWVLAGAPGLPPIRLPVEGTPFGSVAVGPFVLLGTWAIAGAIEDPRLRRPLRTVIVAVGIPTAVLSGSRSAWLAMGVTALLLAVPLVREHGRAVREWSRSGRAVIVAGLGLVAAATIVVLIAPRLGAVTSLLYRGELWRDTLRAWWSAPISGIGPGIMPFARQAAAPDFSFPVSQPHSHNLALGVLGDAGLVALVAAAALVGTFAVVAGPWRSRTSVGRGASAALLGIGVSGLFEDLTFLPNFNLIVILLAAIALADAGVVAWTRPARARPALAIAAALGGLVLLAGMVVADAGAISYRMASDAAGEARWPEAEAGYQRSVAIDPWHPLGPDALAVARAAAGDVARAREPLEAATMLNDGNGRAWANLAVVCGELGDTECQLNAAARAVARARREDQGLVNAAISFEQAQSSAAADAAYRRSLLILPTTSLAVSWPRAIPIGDGAIAPTNEVATDLNLLLARIAMGEPIRPDDYASHSVRALAHAAEGEEEASRAAIERARQEEAEAVLTWQIDMVLARAWGESTAYAEQMYELLRGAPPPAPDAQSAAVPPSRYDIGSFRIFPRGGLVPGAEDLHTDPVFPWVLGEVLPDSGG